MKYLLLWVWRLIFRRHRQPWRYSSHWPLRRILNESSTRILLTTILRLVACLKTDITLPLTGFSHVSNFTAHIALDSGTSVASVPDLLATKTVVSRTVFCVVSVDLVAYFAFEV
jgi:hypothetical protein